jgi:hypothetical protein
LRSGYGTNGKALAWQKQSPESNPQYQKERKKKNPLAHVLQGRSPTYCGLVLSSGCHKAKI